MAVCGTLALAAGTTGGCAFETDDDGPPATTESELTGMGPAQAAAAKLSSRLFSAAR